MFGRAFHRIIVAAGFSSMAAALWAASAYLPVVGPLPLRFRALPLLSTNPVSLPAPLPAPPEVPMEEEPDNEESDSPPAVIPPLAGTNADGSPSAVLMEASSVPQNERAPDPVVSPQMLMQYFRASTNPATVSPTQAVGFQPPIPSGTTGHGPKPAQ
jgi:hypothetical protein